MYNDVQWCTMSVLTSTHGAHRMPSQRLFGLIDQQKRCHTHCVGTLTFKPRLCIHAGSLIFSGMSSLHELRGKLYLRESLWYPSYDSVILCDPSWSFVILCDPSWSLGSISSLFVPSPPDWWHQAPVSVAAFAAKECSSKFFNLQKHRDVLWWN